MGILLNVDRAIYEVDRKTRTYRYHSRNLEWKELSPEQNQKNKKSLKGYRRIFPDGRTKVFHYKW